MKNILTILTLSCLIMAASCGKEKAPPIDTAKLNISFKATYDGQTLVLNEGNYDFDGKAIQFSKLNFYISNLVAVNNDGETELSEIQYINLSETHSSIEDAEKGSVMSFSKVPVGAYNQLRFGVGVPADLNKTTPADYSTNHPLGITEAYSEKFKSYIFLKIEGQYDFDENGLDASDVSFEYRPSFDGVYTYIELDNPIDLRGGETYDLDFELDIKTLLTYPNGDFIELEDNNPDYVGDMILIMGNFKKALHIK